MPYEIRKVDKGWKVFTKGTDRSHSNDPLPLYRAKDQLKALYANNADEDTKMRGGMIGGFDDGDWDKLFGVYGGAEDDDEDAQAKEDSEAIVRLDKDEKSFDVEEATGEPEYLKLAKQYAKKAGYKDAASLKLADDGKHKLMLRGVKFGSINNNDYIIYRQHFPSIAEQKRKQYLARARKIKGDWAKDKYSPNSLAINILWDGSSKKGGFDWAGLASDFVKDAAAAAPGFIIDNFGTEEAREKKRKVDEACKVCKEGYGMSGGRLAQTDAEETKVAKQILNKVAGEANAAVREISETPMSDANIRRYFPNAKVLKYSELADVEDITQLLPQPKSFFFLLYEQSFNSGHFVSVNRYIDNGRDTICFFCSYGSKIDAPLRWNSPEKNRELGQGEPYLTQLLRKSGKHIQYNRVQYQSKTSPKATCGAFATLWLKANIRDNMTLQEFHEWITEIKDETGLTYDAIAANAISTRD